MSRHAFHLMKLVDVDGVIVPCDDYGNPWPSTPVQVRWLLPKQQREAIERLAQRLKQTVGHDKPSQNALRVG